MRKLVVLFLVSGCGVDLERDPFASGECGPELGGEGEAQALPSGLVLSLGLASDYSSSSVDALNESLSARDTNRLIASGDAVLRPLGDQAVVVNRGAQSNLQLVNGATRPGAQVSLGACNPHDVAWLAGCRALVTCYDSAVMKIVDLSNGEVTDGPDLSPLADGDGLPEADQLHEHGDVILVSLQRLDRDAFYSPVGPGFVAELDAVTLELRDRDSEAAGVQALELPCQNPYTDFAAAPDGRAAIACFGNFIDNTTAGVAWIHVEAGSTTLLADGVLLGGPPSALRVDSQGRAVLLVSSPNAFDTDEMLLVRVDDEVEELYSSRGFSLAGLAVGSGDTVYVGNRSASDDAGLWRVFDDGRVTGPVTTSLPPFEIEVW